MKSYIYHCDGSQLVLGNENFLVKIYNNHGDGAHKIYVTEPGETPMCVAGCDVSTEEQLKHNFESIGTVHGKFNVYNYDYLKGEELVDASNIIVVLEGHYHVYVEKPGVYGGDLWLQGY